MMMRKGGGEGEKEAGGASDGGQNDLSPPSASTSTVISGHPKDWCNHNEGSLPVYDSHQTISNRPQTESSASGGELSWTC